MKSAHKGSKDPDFEDASLPEEALAGPADDDVEFNSEVTCVDDDGFHSARSEAEHSSSACAAALPATSTGYQARTPNAATEAATEPVECVMVPLRVWRECKKCGVERPKTGYSKKMWKACNDNPSILPACSDCRGGADKGEVEETGGDSPSTPAIVVAKVVEEVVRAGFHSSVVEHLQRSVGRSLSVEELSQMARDCQEENSECGICFYPFSNHSALHVMLFRPCCRQPICRTCDYRCHFPDRPFAFCRSTCGSVVKTCLPVASK